VQYIFGIRPLSCYCHHQLLLNLSTIFNDHNVRQLSLFAIVLWNSSSLKTRFCIIYLRLLTPITDCIHVRWTLIPTIILTGIDDDANVNAIINVVVLVNLHPAMGMLFVLIYRYIPALKDIGTTQMVYFMPTPTC